MATNQQTINNTIYYGTATFKDVNNNKCYIGNTSTESMTVADVTSNQLLYLNSPDIYKDTTREVKYYDVSVVSSIRIPLKIQNASGARRVVDFLRIYWDGAAYVDDSAHWAVNISPGALSSGGDTYSTYITLPTKGTSKGRLRIQMGDFTAKVQCVVTLTGYTSCTLDDSDKNGIHNYLFNFEGSYMKILSYLTNIFIQII